MAEESEIWMRRPLGTFVLFSAAMATANVLSACLGWIDVRQAVWIYLNSTACFSKEGKE